MLRPSLGVCEWLIDHEADAGNPNGMALEGQTKRAVGFREVMASRAWGISTCGIGNDERFAVRHAASLPLMRPTSENDDVDEKLRVKYDILIDQNPGYCRSKNVVGHEIGQLSTYEIRLGVCSGGSHLGVGFGCEFLAAEIGRKWRGF